MTLLFDRLKNNQGTLQSLQRWQLGLEPVGGMANVFPRHLLSFPLHPPPPREQTPIYSSWGSAQLWQRGAAPPPATSWGAGSKEPPSNWGAERDRDRLRHDLGGGRLVVVVAGVNGVGGDNHGWHGDDGDDDGSCGGTQFRFSIDANQGSARTAIDLSLSRLLILPLDQTRDHLITFGFKFFLPEFSQVLPENQIKSHFWIRKATFSFMLCFQYLVAKKTNRSYFLNNCNLSRSRKTCLAWPRFKSTSSWIQLQ